MDRFTKIVATIGPSSDSEEMIESLIRLGVNVFRFNFKHSEVEWHQERIRRVKSVSQKIAIPVGTLIDLQGPEIRIRIANKEISVEEGEEIMLTADPQTDTKGFSISYPHVVSALEDGQKVFVDDGTFTFTVKKSNDDVRLVCHNKGTIKDRKSMNIPGLEAPLPVLVEKDYHGLDLAKEEGINFIALSFVRSVDDINVLRDEMKKRNLEASVVSKIEAQKALDNLDSIIKASDVIMVARGDLGVEIPVEEVPYYQKIMIKKCIENSVPVITATQMLQTMVDDPFPTRAEVSDVANAAYDLTDAVMLSGETASGKYPLEAVKIMSKTVLFNENKFMSDRRSHYQYQVKGIEDMVCDSAYSFSIQCIEKQKKIVGFIVFTVTGKTVNLLSRYRPHIPIFAFTQSSYVRDILNLNYGVKSFITDVFSDKFITKEDLESCVQTLISEQMVEKGDRLIMVYGDTSAEAGRTDSLKIITV